MMDMMDMMDGMQWKYKTRVRSRYFLIEHRRDRKNKIQPVSATVIVADKRSLKNQFESTH